MIYKNYTAAIEWSEEAGAYFGRVNNTTDVITFFGNSVNELRCEMAASIEAHLAFCAEKGVGPDKPDK